MKAKQTLLNDDMNIFISEKLCFWALEYFVSYYFEIR